MAGEHRDGHRGKPGEIVAMGRDGIVVVCGKGTLVLEIVQKIGGKKLSAASFLSGMFHCSRAIASNAG